MDSTGKQIDRVEEHARLYTPGQLLSVTWDECVATAKRHPLLLLFFAAIGPAAKSLVAFLVPVSVAARSPSGGLSLIPQAIGILATFCLYILLKERYQENVWSTVKQYIRTSFVSYVVLSFLVFFTIMGGMLLLIVPGIVFSIWFLFSAFVFIYDGKKGVMALAGSYEYIHGHTIAVIFNNVSVGIFFSLPVVACTILAKFVPIPLIVGVVRVLSWVFTVVAQTLWTVALVVQFERLRQLRGELHEIAIPGSVKFAARLGKAVGVVTTVLFLLFLLSMAFLAIFPRK